MMLMEPIQFIKPTVSAKYGKSIHNALKLREKAWESMYFERCQKNRFILIISKESLINRTSLSISSQYIQNKLEVVADTYNRKLR